MCVGKQNCQLSFGKWYKDENGIWLFKALWSLYVPPGLTLETILHSANIVYLRILYESYIKQRLFLYSALSNYICNQDGVFAARYGLNVHI
jgi:hypothetical protein